jgi:hypothetical protein
MSNYLAVATVTAAIKQLVLTGLQNAPWGFPYDLSVTTAPPDVARTQAREALGQVNLFLYESLPSGAWRNQPTPEQSKPGERGFPPLALDLRYILTAYAPSDDGVEAHRLLGCALASLHDHPLLSRDELRAAVEHSDLHEQPERVRLSPHTLSLTEMSTLWSMCQKAYNLSVGWQASVVLVESLRARSAALPVLTRGGPGDPGLTVNPNVGPFSPTVESIAPPAAQASVRLGETLTIGGVLLDGALVRVVVSQSRWVAPKSLTPAAVAPEQVLLELPAGATAEAEWPAGLYTLSLVVIATVGEPERTTNELPFTLAPTISSVSPAMVAADPTNPIALTLQVSPLVSPGQRVALIVGDRVCDAAPIAVSAAELHFSVPGLTPGRYRLRLRVDGVDSIVIDRSTTPPSFVGPELDVQ